MLQLKNGAKKLKTPLSGPVLKGLASLAQESQPELFYQDLYQLGIQARDRGELPTAALIFQGLQDPGWAVSTQLRSQAQGALHQIEGSAQGGDQLEWHIKQMIRGVASPIGIASMGAAGLTFGATRVATFGLLNRFKTLSALTGGWGAHGLAFGTGLLAESAAFVGVHRGLASLTQGPSHQESLPLGKEYLSTLIMLGLLKTGGGLTRGLLGKPPAQGAWLHRAPHVLLPQASMLASIMGSQYLDAKYIWHREPDLSLVNGLVTLVHFNAVGKLMTHSLGRPYQRLMHDLGQRSKGLRLNLARQLAATAGAGQEIRVAQVLGPKEKGFGTIMMMNGNNSNGAPKAKEGESVSDLPTQDYSQPILITDSAPYAIDLKPADIRTGQVVAKNWKIEKTLGRGGMGIVYLAKHKVLGKQVAIKSLLSDFATDPGIITRFLREAKAASSLKSPHIVDIQDYGSFQDGAPYYIMEYLNGKPLDQRMSPFVPIPTKEIINLGQQITRGMMVAHEAGIIHRDLKPENIFVTKTANNEDLVKILDFGLAKILNAKTKLTATNAPMGTPVYMSPEQILSDQSIDHRTDIYALGIILYEMAAGRVPFEAESYQRLYAQHLREKPAPLFFALQPAVAKKHKVSPGLEAIIMKCLEKDPNNRYQSMKELHDDLELLRTGRTPLALAKGNSSPPQKLAWRISDFFAMRHLIEKSPPWKIIGGVSGVLALGAVGGYILSQRKEGEETAPPLPAAPTPQNSAAVPLSPSAEPETSDDREIFDIEDLEIDRPKTPPKAQQTEVTLKVTPSDARVYLDTVDLGTSPVQLDVHKGQKMEVEIKRKGYRPQVVTLDDSKTEWTVKLKPIPAPPPGTSVTQPQPTTPPLPTPGRPGDWKNTPWD